MQTKCEMGKSSSQSLKRSQSWIPNYTYTVNDWWNRITIMGCFSYNHMLCYNYTTLSFKTGEKYVICVIMLCVCMSAECYDYTNELLTPICSLPCEVPVWETK
jgi:hypothetical protein